MQGPPESLFIGPRRRKLIAPLKGLVLEIGAGTGLSLHYYSRGARVVATEPDMASVERLVQKAEKSVADVTVVAADAMRVPFADCTFDGLVCNLALCTIPDPSLALAEAWRVLKPGARPLSGARAGGYPLAGLYAGFSGACVVKNRRWVQAQPTDRADNQGWGAYVWRG